MQTELINFISFAQNLWQNVKYRNRESECELVCVCVYLCLCQCEWMDELVSEWVGIQMCDERDKTRCPTWIQHSTNKEEEMYLLYKRWQHINVCVKMHVANNMPLKLNRRYFGQIGRTDIYAHQLPKCAHFDGISQSTEIDRQIYWIRKRFNGFICSVFSLNHSAQCRREREI